MARVKHGWRDDVMSIAAAVDREMDGSYYGRGSLETTAATAGNVATAFGKLIELLYDKKILQADEMRDFIGYGSEIVE